MNEKPKQPVSIEVVPPLTEGTPEELIRVVNGLIKIPSTHPRVLLFPEAVLGDLAITRIEGKKLARALHELVSQTPGTYIFYSVYEKSPWFKIMNTGYIIKPKINPNDTPYTVYPKLATFEHGKQPTHYDSSAFYLNGFEQSDASGRIYKANNRIKSFPRVTICGLVFELRVCADIGNESVQDPIRARKNPIPADVILVPAANLFLARKDWSPLWSELSPKGFAIINDPSFGGISVLKKKAKQGKFKTTGFESTRSNSKKFMINPEFRKPPILQAGKFVPTKPRKLTTLKRYLARFFQNRRR